MKLKNKHRRIIVGFLALIVALSTLALGALALDEIELDDVTRCTSVTFTVGLTNDQGLAEANGYCYLTLLNESYQTQGSNLSLTNVGSGFYNFTFNSTYTCTPGDWKARVWCEKAGKNDTGYVVFRVLASSVASVTPPPGSGGGGGGSGPVVDVDTLRRYEVVPSTFNLQTQRQTQSFTIKNTGIYMLKFDILFSQSIKDIIKMSSTAITISPDSEQEVSFELIPKSDELEYIGQIILKPDFISESGDSIISITMSPMEEELDKPNLVLFFDEVFTGNVLGAVGVMTDSMNEVMIIFPLTMTPITKLMIYLLAAVVWAGIWYWVRDTNKKKGKGFGAAWLILGLVLLLFVFGLTGPF